MESNFNNQILNDWNNDQENIFAKGLHGIVNGYTDLENLKNALISVASEALFAINTGNFDAQAKETKINKIMTVLDFASKMDIENEMSYLDNINHEAKKKTNKVNVFDMEQNPVKIWFKNGIDPSENKKQETIKPELSDFTLDDYLRLNKVSTM